MRSPNLLSAFQHAFSGLAYAIRTQRNARIHTVATVLVIAASIWTGLNADQWCLITLAIAIVWMSELANTAVETIVDLISPDIHPLAKIAKDVKAAAVVVSVSAAIIVGVLILGPALLLKLGYGY